MTLVEGLGDGLFLLEFGVPRFSASPPRSGAREVLLINLAIDRAHHTIGAPFALLMFVDRHPLLTGAQFVQVFTFVVFVAKPLEVFVVS